MTLFIAINVTQEIKEEVKNIQSKLRKSGLFEGSYIHLDNLHLTLKFLGDVEEYKIPKIQDDLKKINFYKIKLNLQNLNFFGHEIIKVIWVGFDSNVSELQNLKIKIYKALEWLEIEDKMEFLSHLTIARVKSVEDREMLEQLISEIKIKPLNFYVDHFSLMSSQLTEYGPIYTEIEKYSAN